MDVKKHKKGILNKKIYLTKNFPIWSRNDYTSFNKSNSSSNNSKSNLNNYLINKQLYNNLSSSFNKFYPLLVKKTSSQYYFNEAYIDSIRKKIKNIHRERMDKTYRNNILSPIKNKNYLSLSNDMSQYSMISKYFSLTPLSLINKPESKRSKLDRLVTNKNLNFKNNLLERSIKNYKIKIIRRYNNKIRKEILEEEKMCNKIDSSSQTNNIIFSPVKSINVSKFFFKKFNKLSRIEILDKKSMTILNCSKKKK
jgi:hypothetical protein